MNPDELREAIDCTKKEIHQLKQMLETAPDSDEKTLLKRRLKDLRILQFRQLDQIG